MRNHEIVKVLNGLEGISKKEFPVEIAYTIRKNMKILMDEYNIYNELLEELKGRYPEEAAGMEIDEQRVYQKELLELLNFETQLELHTFPESVLMEGVSKITLEELGTLECMIK